MGIRGWLNNNPITIIPALSPDVAEMGAVLSVRPYIVGFVYRRDHL